jgi:hypothetical protein
MKVALIVLFTLLVRRDNHNGRSLPPDWGLGYLATVASAFVAGIFVANNS